MASRWDTSRRREELPPNWATEIRPRILRRDGYQCTETLASGARCPTHATDVDHVHRGSDHSDGNLASKCKRHHALKSSREGHEAMRLIRSQAAHPPERHPGYA